MNIFTLVSYTPAVKSVKYYCMALQCMYAIWLWHMWWLSELSVLQNELFRWKPWLGSLCRVLGQTLCFPSISNSLGSYSLIYIGGFKGGGEGPGAPAPFFLYFKMFYDFALKIVL